MAGSYVVYTFFLALAARFWNALWRGWSCVRVLFIERLRSTYDMCWAPPRAFRLLIMRLALGAAEVEVAALTSSEASLVSVLRSAALSLAMRTL